MTNFEEAVALAAKAVAERDRYKAAFERLQSAVVASPIQFPTEWHSRACTCSWCDLDRAMKDSPDFRKRDSAVPGPTNKPTPRDYSSSGNENASQW